MSDIVQLFRTKVTALMAQHPGIPHTWSGPDKKGRITLKIPKSDESGFDIQIDCFPYALYPMPDWFCVAYDGSNDAAMDDKTAQHLLEHLQSLLCDAIFHVRYAGNTPIVWTLTENSGARTHTRHGRRIFFNYLAPRYERHFRNAHFSRTG